MSAVILVSIVCAAGPYVTVHVLTAAGLAGPVLGEAAVGDVLQPQAGAELCELSQGRPGYSASDEWIMMRILIVLSASFIVPVTTTEICILQSFCKLLKMIKTFIC